MANKVGRPSLPKSLRRSSKVMVGFRPEEKRILSMVAASEDTTMASLLRRLFIADTRKRFK